MGVEWSSNVTAAGFTRRGMVRVSRRSFTWNDDFKVQSLVKIAGRLSNKRSLGDILGFRNGFG